MNNTKNIIWLVSYPKSGNTWLRIFLENIRSESDRPVNINDLTLAKIASSRLLFDHYSGLSSSDLTELEIDKFRPDVYQLLSEESSCDVILKVHDAWRINSYQKELFPKEITKAVIYIIRHPLDVLVSNAYHNSVSFRKSAQRMNTNHILCNKRECLYNQLKQELFSWKNHVLSWVDKSKLPVITIRYEDMINNPVKSFSDVLSYIGWKYGEEEIQKAVEFSEIRELQRQEYNIGFREKPIKANSFFRAGRIGSWKELIEEDIVRLMYESNKKEMDRFGYSLDSP